MVNGFLHFSGRPFISGTKKHTWKNVWCLWKFIFQRMVTCFERNQIQCINEVKQWLFAKIYSNSSLFNNAIDFLLSSLHHFCFFETCVIVVVSYQFHEWNPQLFEKNGAIWMILSILLLLDYVSSFFFKREVFERICFRISYIYTMPLKINFFS